MSNPVCGICNLSPRIGQPMRPVRLHAEDARELEKEAGLYLACADCIRAQRGRLAQRRGVRPEKLSHHDLC